MADIIDIAQQRQVEEIERALLNRPQRKAGRNECLVCDEPISGVRRELGAQLCIHHQKVAEAEAAHRRKP
jgi:RNA polymerase-binding transcription factor DksA